ncbi:MAG: polysaccharide biosynthesis tyrosine autokinase [Elusimicrobiota bacterium]
MESHFPTTISGYYELFQKRKKLFYWPALGVLAATALVYPLLPRVYESAATILVDDGRVMGPLVQGQNQKSSFEKKLGVLSAQLLSWPSLAQMANDLGLADDVESQAKFERVVASIRSRIIIRMAGPDLVRVSYEGDDPQLAQKIVDTLTKNLLEKNRRAKQEEAGRTIQFIDGQLRVYKNKLQASEKTFLNNRLKSQIDEARQRRELLLGQMSQMEKTKEVLGAGNPVAAKLQEELQAAQVQLNQLLVDAKKAHPLVTELRQRISDLQSRLRTERMSMASGEGPSSSSNPAYRESLFRLKEVNMQIASLEKRLTELESGKSATVNISEQDVLAMEKDKEVNEDIYRSLLLRLENAQISKNMDETGESQNLRIIEAPRVPTSPSKPRPWAVAGAGLVAALAAGLGAVLLREYFDTSLRGVNDAREFLGLSPLAAIPDKKKETGRRPTDWEEGFPESAARRAPAPEVLKNPLISPHIAAFHNPGSEAGEQYRLLRTHLRHLAEKRPLKTLLLTSTVDGEGKTTTAVNLAVSMSQELSERVLLMDCDLRRGTVKQTLGVTAARGLSDLLTGYCSLDAALTRPPVENLTVLPAGAPVKNPAGLLSTEKFAGLLEVLRSRYDRIIMDAPPVTSLSDVPLLAPHADGSIFVIQAGKSGRELVAEALASLQQKGHVLGFVMTRVDSYFPKYLRQYLEKYYYVGAES